MKILVNAIPLTGLLTGISRYVRQLYREMEKIPDTEISYFDGKRVLSRMPDQADPIKWASETAAIWKLPVPIVFALRALHWLKFEMSLRHVCRKNKFDIYHETMFVPAAMSIIPLIYTIHDLSLITHKHTHPKDRVWFNDFFQKKRLPYATHIMTVSEFIRDQIIDVMNISKSRVTVIPEAAASHFYPRSTEQLRQLRSKFTLPDEYLLFVGALEPRKNLPMVINAMQHCKSTINLVLAGWEGWGDKSWIRRMHQAGLRDRIFFTGYVDDETLACLYSGALALVYPSLYEGFGLPILEAMACGCPVICSDVASMPEVAGDAAIRIDPTSTGGLTAAIDLLAGNQNARQHLIARGFLRAADFTWKRTAEKTREVFQKIASGDLSA
jgi:glycosyltransferase involved in cell wall biosynthesis